MLCYRTAAEAYADYSGVQSSYGLTIGDNFVMQNKVNALFLNNKTIQEQDFYIGDLIDNAYQMFQSCYNFNGNVYFGNNLKNCTGMFSHCNNLNQNIQISDSVNSCISMFYGCVNLNQNIRIPANAISCCQMFENCYLYNPSNITIPQNVNNVVNMFRNCNNLSTNIYFEGDNNINAANMLYGVYDSHTSAIINIYCRNSLPFIGNATANSIRGGSITWSQMADGNGYYNTTYRFNIYNNYTGSGT